MPPDSDAVNWLSSLPPKRAAGLCLKCGGTVMARSAGWSTSEFGSGVYLECQRCNASYGETSNPESYRRMLTGCTLGDVLKNRPARALEILDSIQEDSK